MYKFHLRHFKDKIMVIQACYLTNHMNNKITVTLFVFPVLYLKSFYLVRCRLRPDAVVTE